MISLIYMLGRHSAMCKWCGQVASSDRFDCLGRVDQHRPASPYECEAKCMMRMAAVLERSGVRMPTPGRVMCGLVQDVLIYYTCM